MSFKAMAWATEQEITTTSPQSHLLLILASFANEQNECYPSIATIEKKTRLSHNTIRKCIKELIDFGLIADTKKTSQFNTKVYKLNVDLVGVGIPNLSDTPTKNGSPTNFNTPTNFGMTPLPNLNDTPTKFGSEPLPNLVDNPVINPININHKETCYGETHTHETQADENHQNAKKPKKTSSAKKPKSSDDKLTADDLMKLKLSDFNFSDDDFEDIPQLGDWLFENMDYQVAKDFIAIRKTKLTITAVKMIVKQSALANMNLNSALEFCIDAGWQSFKLGWYLNRQQPQRVNQPQNKPDPLAVNQKNFPTPPNWEENLAKAMAMGKKPATGLTEI